MRGRSSAWARSRPKAPPRDQGSGTVLALALVGALCLLASAGAVLASAVIASHRARAAADLAVLAAADRWLGGATGQEACAAAGQVAAANRAALQDCAAGGETVTLTVAVSPGVGGVPPAVARARAGPAPPPAGTGDPVGSQPR